MAVIDLNLADPPVPESLNPARTSAAVIAANSVELIGPWLSRHDDTRDSQLSRGGDSSILRRVGLDTQVHECQPVTPAWWPSGRVAPDVPFTIGEFT